MKVIWLEQSAGDVPTEENWLSAGELSLLSGMRIPKRRTDWQLGRWTAKHAVAAYLKLPSGAQTLATIEIRPTASGAPEVFFDNSLAKVSVSLSHRSGIGACAVAPSGTMLGCDLELIEPRSEAFVTDYFSADEQTMVARTLAADRPRVIALLWSAKESALKALRVGLRLDTRCVRVILDGGVPSVAEAESETTASPSFPPSERTNEEWFPFHVWYAEDQVFHGWRQVSGELVRTLVAVPSSPPPIVVQMPSSRHPKFKSAILYPKTVG
jgi:4'-phosphopantetheinyl transferase